MKPDEQLAIAKMTHKQMIEAQEIYDIMVNFHFGDKDKTNIWFEHPNTELDNTPPKLFLINGKIDKLRKFIETKFRQKLYQ